jgi:arylsulfatase A-like enzyme
VHTVSAKGRSLRKEEVTIAEYLKQGCTDSPQPCYGDAGTCDNAPCYSTALVGKWHLGSRDRPRAHGFDHFVGFTDGERDPFSQTARYALRACLVVSSPASRLQPNCYGTYAIPSASLCNDDDAPCSYRDRLYRDLAIDLIHSMETQGRPYFLVVAFHAPHLPWNAPERTRQHYMTAPFSSPLAPLLPKYPLPNNEGDPASFWAMLEEMDFAIGRILDAVSSTNTLVLFTSDNGRADGGIFGRPALQGYKNTVTAGGVRMGLLARACDTPSESLDFESFVGGHADIFPTIVEAADFDNRHAGGFWTRSSQGRPAPNSPLPVSPDDERVSSS